MMTLTEAQVGEAAYRAAWSEPLDAAQQARLEAVLQSFDADDEAEQRETGAYLLRALNEDRLSDRKLLPDCRFMTPRIEARLWRDIP